MSPWCSVSFSLTACVIACHMPRACQEPDGSTIPTLNISHTTALRFPLSQAQQLVADWMPASCLGLSREFFQDSNKLDQGFFSLQVSHSKLNAM